MSFSSNYKRLSIEEKRQREFYENYDFEKNDIKIVKNNNKNLLSILLDNSLIIQSLSKNGTNKFYDTKIIDCGNYFQVYKFQDRKDKKEKGLEKEKKNERKVYNICKVDTDDLRLIEEKEEKEKRKRKEEKKEIEEKNINRTKFQLTRLIKANEEEFKTFITLTFANYKKIEINKKEMYYWLSPKYDLKKKYEIFKNNNIIKTNIYELIYAIENYSSIEKANKTFNVWRTNFKLRYKKDFKYICVPEFQKNGTIHYHLLTNIQYDDFKLLNEEEMNIYKKGKRKSGWLKFRTLKSWKYGFSNVQDMKNMNVVGYLTKYMTKDIDNRLFGYRRYFYSRDLIKPCVLYIDSYFNDRLKYILEKCSDISFKKDYADKFGCVIEYTEYRKFEDIDIKEFLEKC